MKTILHESGKNTRVCAEVPLVKIMAQKIEDWFAEYKANEKALRKANQKSKKLDPGIPAVK